MKDLETALKEVLERLQQSPDEVESLILDNLCKDTTVKVLPFILPARVLIRHPLLPYEHWTGAVLLTRRLTVV
jgi:hypothetical protein